MFVKAKKGSKCPKENNYREYIDEDGAEVPETAYYLRLINDGSLTRPDAVASPRVGEVGEGAAPHAAKKVSTDKGGKQS